ncbi:DUF3068 domain-containing protein [Streptomyces poonensis]|uniref:DUF3068 domain-containing protein n=1 Tax=Streptomyces poonensis TaxID=68255 RepID=A0A918UHB7_9ACTN|nr:DUF3068 domain-containing protein [Streptomyces poonensis]GGZ11771.1 hypothetical protein GCM10010365_34330 [Streptomyces poonensis]GLJ92652.1 hypothetical protein GCM10017589_52620 [Streptomyces poonensis]
MRRHATPFSLVLLGLGTFLLVLAPLLAWYVTPRVAVNPVDVDTTAVYTGTGSVFDAGRLRTVPGRHITVTQRVRGDVAASERSGHAAVWDVVTTVDTDETLPAADPHDALDLTPHRWVSDRRTNRPVHCCGEQPYIEGEAYLKFPFDVQRRPYRWWDNTLGAPVVLRYQGVEKVRGYEGYRFTGSVPATRTGSRPVPGRIVGAPDRPQVLAEEWYANHGIELVVDRTTGRVLHAQTGPRRTLRAPGAHRDAAVLLDSRKLAFTPATQRAAVAQAQRDGERLRLLGRTVPFGAAVAGSALAVAGAVLVIRGRRRPG